jgi:hypothetical protein
LRKFMASAGDDQPSEAERRDRRIAEAVLDCRKTLADLFDIDEKWEAVELLAGWIGLEEKSHVTPDESANN